MAARAWHAAGRLAGADRMARLLLTGSAGLIGRALRDRLTRLGHDVRGLDLALPAGHPERGDAREPDTVMAHAADRDGILHLAAIARVGASAADPGLCRTTNVGAVRAVLQAAWRLPRRPFVLLASSREVHGEPLSLPVPETAPIAPINVYGRSKAAAELLVEAARARGLRAQIIRYANVYGGIADHPDRVVPAFARTAALGGMMHVRGGANAFDFTHVDDAAAGTARAIEAMLAGEWDMPPIQLASGRPTRLIELARLAARLGQGRTTIVEEPSVASTVSRFWGDPTRARELLGWQARIDLPTGLAALIGAFASHAAARPLVA